MTDTDTPFKPEPVLGYYQGRPVVGATIQITNTGAGLDKGLAMAPVELEGGGTYDVVLRCRVTEHRHEPLGEDWTELQLVNRLKAEHATLIEPGDVASEVLDRAEQLVAERRAEEEERKRAEKGEQTLPFPEGNGEPEAVGDVIDAAIDLATVAEHTADWRNHRTRELDGFDKDGLTELAKTYELTGYSKLTKAELVELLVDHEETNGGEVPF